MSEPIPKKIGMYNIVRLLGSGGMGVVYLAEHSLIRRQVALKVIKSDLDTQTHFNRFIREAVLLSELSHPHIITLHEVNTEGSLWYFVMEYLPGGSVQDVLQQRRLSWLEATQMLIDACRGLQAAHTQQILHRDLKPSNLLLTKDGRVKLADFGLAKATQSSATPLTGQGVVGTPRYMSPEQCRAEPLTVQSDLYSLGATYYTFLTRAVPFAHATEPLQVMYAHCETTLSLAPLRHAQIPDGCIRLVERLMAKQPHQRYADCAALLRDAEALLLDQTPHPSSTNRVLALPELPSSDMTALSAILPPSDAWSTHTTALPVPRPVRRRVFLGAGLGLAVSAGAGGLWWAMRPPKPNSAPIPPDTPPIDARDWTLALPAVPYNLAFSPDGQLLAAAFRSGAGGVRVWDAYTGAERGHHWANDPIQHLVFSRDGQYLAATTSGFGRVHVLHWPSRQEYTVRHRDEDHDFAAIAAWGGPAPFVVAHQPDGGGFIRFAPLMVTQRLVEGAPQKFRGEPLAELLLNVAGTWAFSAHRDKHVALWRIADRTFTLHDRLPVPTANADTLRFTLNPAQDRLAIAAGKSVRLYAVPPERNMVQDIAIPHDVWEMQFTTDGHFLLVTGAQVSVVALATGHVVQQLTDQLQTVYRTALHPKFPRLAFSQETNQGKMIVVKSWQPPRRDEGV